MVAAVCGLAIAACQAPAPEKAPDYAAELRPAFDAFTESALNGKDYDGIGTSFADDFRRIAPDFNANSREEMIEGIRQIHAANPAFRITTNESVFGKSIAFTQWTMTGTATSDDGSTNKINIEGATMMRFVDGHITAEWVYFDSAQFANPSGEVGMKHAE